MKIALAAVTLALSVLPAQARPSPHPDQFAGDRYTGRTAQAGTDGVRAVRTRRQPRSRHYRRHRAKHSQRAPVVRQISAAEGMTLAAWRAATGRPAAWCGWWLGHHLGMPLRRLWLARNWASVGSSAGGPQVGAIVVWRHHVGIITGRQNGQWVVKSGNDGRRVRERPRSVAGAIAFRRI